MDYDDFDLRLLRDGRQYAVQVDCPEGEAFSPMARDSAPEAGAGLVAHFQALLSRKGLGPLPSASRDYAQEADELHRLEVAGRELFALAFPAETSRLWHRCLARTAEAGRGLRLRIHVDLEQRQLAWLGALPWELLYDDDSGGFLALDARTPVVRYLDMRRARRSLPRARPWRVLMVAPEPYGVERLDVARERTNLLETWGEDGRVEPVLPDRFTFDDVRAVLRREPIHAIHFVGHGDFDDRTGWGSLIFEGPMGRPVPIGGPILGGLVRGLAPPPALAVLNGCSTARTDDLEGAWAFSGAAAALVKAGIPAAVAMQQPMADLEAIQCSKILYRVLQDGQSVDAAMAEARLSLQQGFPGPTWAIPALHLRTLDGCLALPAESSEPESPPPREGSSVEVEVHEVDLDGSAGEIVGREDFGNAPSARPGEERTRVHGTGLSARNSSLKIIGVRRGKD
jgi:hypothetical protein